ncbi:MAG: PAS domain-containing sensor histidine kinase [Hoeflea sp.]|uniref:PAS domain-containing sensor histidine kinase n=1 Tax=Hoeflea sp. TaxID=1940281 RepID=UPI003EF535AF
MSLPVSPEGLLQALYETLPDPVMIINADRKFVASNAAATKVFGFSAQEFLELGPADFYASAADAREVGEAFFPLEKETKPLHRRFNFLRRDGSVIPIELTANKIRDADGKAVAFVAILRDLSEMVAAQDERLRAESILNTALDSISEGFVVFDEQDRLVLCNNAYRKIYPLTAPVMQVGRTFESIVRYGLDRGQYPEAGDTPETREAWLQERLERHNNPGERIIQRVGPDRWLQIEERVTSENYRVGVRTDVSALRRANSESERLGAILEEVGQEVYLIRLRDQKFIYANTSACENLQYSLEDLRERDLRLINDDPSPREWGEKFGAISRGEVSVLFVDTRHKRKDGTTYVFRVRLERMDYDSEPVLLALGDDITERLEIERSLARKEHEFETLVQNLPDLITRAKADTTLTYVNENYARFVGLHVDQMIGRKFLEFVPDDHRSSVMAHLANLTLESPIATSEQAMVSQSGEQFWYLWSNLMVFKDGEPVELVSVGRNITEVREAQTRIAIQSHALELRNDALEKFSGIVSHDLKAPLRQIRLFADMIAEDVGADKTEDLALFSGYISERSESMEQMTSNLLEYSQLAYQQIKPKIFRLSEAVSAAWGNLAVDVEEAKAQLISETDIEVHADFVLLTQLFQNLFSNSMKYRQLDSPAIIRVRARTVDNVATITVEDDGIGIDAAQSERVFGVFQRLHADEKLYSGSGIGLALCRRIAESHDGLIFLDPAYQGGARFIVTLPV